MEVYKNSKRLLRDTKNRSLFLGMFFFLFSFFLFTGKLTKHTNGRDNAVPGTGQLFDSVHRAISEISEGCTIYGINVRILPHDCAFFELKAHW